MDQTTATSPVVCSCCDGTKCLTQKGVAIIYLLPHKFAMLLLFVGVALAIWRGSAWLALTLAGYLLPLLNADLRLLLYPFVAIAALCGRKPNCPKCERHGDVFRLGYPPLRPPEASGERIKQCISHEPTPCPSC
jgi:hypothetical protein